MTLTKTEIVQLYRRRAKRYNFSANLYYLIGFREQKYREMAVDALRLRGGDTVVEIGCGTGLNFPFLERAVGPQGGIIGLDLTDEMLGRAWERIQANHWSNVELIRADAAGYDFPAGLGGVISTFAITLVPEYDRVIKKASKALAAGKRCVILDLKKPGTLPSWLMTLAVLITKPFGVSTDLMERHPWESIEKYFGSNSNKELYFGFAYLSVGEAARTANQRTA
jgi:ubiquinone/menaquinone biosynthesis C-methylase UbiE